MISKGVMFGKDKMYEDVQQRRNARDGSKKYTEICRGRDARGETRDVWRCTRSEDASDGMGEKDLQWGCPRLLIVVLEVAQVDRLRLLNLIHVLKSYSTA